MSSIIPLSFSAQFHDVVRGPELTDVASSLRGHDFLSDQYGFGFKGTIATATATTASSPTSVNTGDQFIEVTLTNDEVTPLHNPTNTNAPLGDISGIYEGLVFSFVSGPASGVSTRIVRHFINGTTHRFWVTPTWIDRGAVPVANLVDSEIIINGREFSGIGAGSYTMDDSVGPEALEPNRVGSTLDDFRRYYMGSTSYTGTENGTPSRCFNEPYDAADFQNMFLSGRDTAGNIIPSFHRRSLYEYNFSAMDTPDQIKRYSFRPRYADIDGTPGPDPGSTANADFVNYYNRNYDTMSPAFDLDVDNDNDGVLDSVFIDPGYGIQTDREGRRFKPLVAYHIVDLDGRLNLNAHGNLTQVLGYDNFIDVSSPVNMLGAAAALPRGEGYGPAEISLGQTRAGFPAQFLFDPGTYQSLLAARYGADGVPGDGGASGKSRSKLIGYPVEEVDWLNGRFGTVNRFNATAAFRPSLFASSPMNIHGRFAFGTPLDTFVQTGNSFDDFEDPNYPNFSNGMPVIDMLASTQRPWVGATTLVEFYSNPYEMSFAPLPFGDPNDNPFTAPELERVLRQYDTDSRLLPSRLSDVTGTALNGGQRELITTDSFEVPTLHENLKIKLIRKLIDENPGLTVALAGARADQMVDSNQQDMFATELLAGLKMDINRALGNGYDDDQDGEVDDPSEANTDQNWDNDSAQMDLNNDGTPGIPAAFQQRPRVRLARHLYMLALLVTDQIAVDYNGDGTIDAADTNAYQRIVAQWAVNVVDFRDPDSIMTRFIYDPTPWDGTWDPTETVWGCERPELLITETIAVHPRRTEDLTTDPSGDDVAGGDPHFDQGLRPEPFAYIELYNPWTQNSLNQSLPASLYDTAAQGVELDRVTVAANGDRSPVWRLAIDRPDRDGDPSTVDPNARTMRYVYFVNPDIDSDAIDDDDGANVEVFFPDATLWNPAPLKPGTQALIGTLGFVDPNNADSYRAYAGRRDGKVEADEVGNTLDLDTTQHIAINPTAGEVTRYPADPTNDPRYSVILPIDIARLGTKNSPTETRRFSVSDAFEGYTDLDANGLPYVEIVDGDGYRYTTPHDVPFDAPSRTDNNRNAEDLERILADEGMSTNFRTIKLQRLANPLLPWNDTDNPYLTIDVMEMDLVAFNGVVANPSTDPDTVIAEQPDKFAALERGAEGLEFAPSDTNDTRHRELWRSSRGTIAAGTPFGVADTHYYNFQLFDSLGKTNDTFTNAQAVADGNGFAWLTWNNRPFVSHLELANVPFAEPEWLTRNFTTMDNSNPYNGFDQTVRGRFRHLLNFFANDDDSGAARANFYRLMDFVEVPSRFLGTEQKLNPTIFQNSPFNVLSRYRVPGKINLNTIYNDPGNAGASTIWNALQGEFSGALGCTWAQFRASRANAVSSPGTDFGNPFRPAGTGGNVPLAGLAITGPGSTVFRRNTTTNDPLFDFTSTNATNNADRSAYFRNAQRQRLGNLVTTKSSVFAVWITVAYFEVDEQGRVGLEIGADTGEIKRNRGFYIYDRSIPVAFEPGKNHNVERGILVQSIID